MNDRNGEVPAPGVPTRFPQLVSLGGGLAAAGIAWAVMHLVRATFQVRTSRSEARRESTRGRRPAESSRHSISIARQPAGILLYHQDGIPLKLDTSPSVTPRTSPEAV